MIRIMSGSVRAPVITLCATALDYRISSASMMGHTPTLPIHCDTAMAQTCSRFLASPAYIANAQLNEFYTRRIGSLVRGRTTVRDVQTLFGHAQAVSRRPDGVVYYYTLDVFNPFEQFGSGRH